MRSVRLALLALCLTPGLAAAKTLASAEVTLSVFHGFPGGKTILRVSYQADKAAAMGDALVVYAEPDHIPILAHINRNGAHAKRAELDLLVAGVPAIASGGTTDFSHTVVVPWDLLIARELREVAIVMRDGSKETVLSRVRVNGLPFEATSSFSLSFSGAGALAYKPGGQWNHCCRGPLCGQICTDCQSAFFSCDLVNCEISCEDL